MKITSFNPLILTKKPEEVIALFEALGFERRHQKTGEVGNGENNPNFSSVRMKDANGYHVDVCTANSDRLERDMTIIRMNVDDFDEACAFLTARGFVNPQGDHTVDTKSNRSAMLISPSGFALDLCQHIKDHD
jgi:hypothetical protein